MTWCYVPGTDFPSAQAAEDLIWASCLPSRVSIPVPLSSGRNTPDNPSLPHSAPDTSHLRQSGMTSPHSTDSPSGEQSTPSSRGIPASRSAPPDSVVALMTNATSGPMLPASSAKSIPNGSFSKMSRDTSASALKPCCETYGTWAERLRLAYSRRAKQARRTNGSGSSSWPTATAHSFAQTADNPTPGQTGGTTLAGAAEMLWPTPMAVTPAQNGNSAAGNSDFTRKMDALVEVMWKTPSAQEPGVTGNRLINKDGTPWMGGERAYDAETGRLAQTGLPQMVDNWTTPQAHDVTMRGAGQVPTSKAGNACLARDAAMWFTPNVPNGGRTLKEGTSPTGMTPDGIKRQVGLENQVVLWGTPRASDAEKGSPNQAFGAGGTPLPAQAAQWPTPAARDHKGENGADHLTNGTGRLHMDQLPNAVAHGFSRPDLPTRPDGLKSLQTIRLSRRLFRSAMLNVPATTTRRWLKKGAWRKARLNPNFVGQLMGFPKDHLNSGFWETQSFRCRPRWHGLHSPEHTDWSESNGQMQNLPEGISSQQATEHEGKRETDILQCGVSPGITKGDGDQVSDMWDYVRSDRAGHASEILQQRLFCSVLPKGDIAALQGEKHRWQENAGTPMGDGTAFGAQPSHIRARSPQERDQDGQQAREPRDHQSSRPRPAASPADAATDDRLCDLRNDIHPAQDEARQDQHLFAPMPCNLCAEPAVGFLKWQQHMRGALSQMPTASGPWIWKPTIEEPQAVQMVLI